ncbi:DUF4238 domain-containing protein [Arthrobacter sp. ZGTC412]|uniref:DUF4238 domain-containing protein n=1 Tax=Arthrobacter sp. ZGTC412 TaxID=2058900 RepID=UPI000CE43BB7|nr:DUF4238 domain-containing protein [Arthrobacter sp. ZGTC412]
MEVSKRHHTVPNFYLKGFGSTDSKPKIGAVSLDDGKRLVMPTSNATVRKNFYALDGHPDGADVFEKELSRIEGDASAVIRKAVEGAWSLSREDREILGTFLTFQFLRGPDTRAWMDQTQGTVLSKVITQMGAEGVRKTLARSDKEVSDEVQNRLIQQAVEPDGIIMKTTPAGHIRHILELVPELVRYFVGRPWVLIRFNRKKLFTCDTPVALVRDPEQEDVCAGVGLMTAWGISIPLTREVGLLLSNPMALVEEAADRKTPRELLEDVISGRYDHEQAGSTKMAQLFNSHTIANARNWLFHHPDDADLVPDELPGPRNREVESEVISG